MSSEHDRHHHDRRTGLRSVTPHASASDVYRANDVDPSGVGIHECQHPDCREADGLQLVRRRGGDTRVYCPTHRDADWGVKIE